MGVAVGCGTGESVGVASLTAVGTGVSVGAGVAVGVASLTGIGVAVGSGVAVGTGGDMGDGAAQAVNSIDKGKISSTPIQYPGVKKIFLVFRMVFLPLPVSF